MRSARTPAINARAWDAAAVRCGIIGDADGEHLLRFEVRGKGRGQKRLVGLEQRMRALLPRAEQLLRADVVLYERAKKLLGQRALRPEVQQPRAA